jgi:hypothetical protein
LHEVIALRAILREMAHQVPLPPPGFDDLPVEDKLDYVEALWDRILGTDEVPTPQWHLDIIEERLANPEPTKTATVEEFLDDVRAKLRGRTR